MEKTFKRDHIPYLVHHLLGKRVPAVDFDYPVMASMYSNSVLNEYKFLSSRRKLSAIIDYKHVIKDPKNQLIGLNNGFKGAEALKAQIDICNNEYKQPMPFYVVLYWLDPTVWKTPMYYVVPANEAARDPKNNGCQYPIWCTLRQFSWFQHNIRKLAWEMDEEINQTAVDEVGHLVGFQFSKSYKLDDLNDDAVHYELPQLDFPCLTEAQPRLTLVAR